VEELGVPNMKVNNGKGGEHSEQREYHGDPMTSVA